ncbi:MAG: hypothetical protein PVG79_12280 [Gemmatimonadales bacterium]|jgi:hypothetical protein
MKRLLVFLTPAILACAGATHLNYAPFFERYGCDPVAVRDRAVEIKGDDLRLRQYQPRVGWSVCELFAHRLAPREVRQAYSQDPDEQLVVFVYRTECQPVAGVSCSDEMPVILKQDKDGVWRVVRVG